MQNCLVEVTNTEKTELYPGGEWFTSALKIFGKENYFLVDIEEIKKFFFEKKNEVYVYTFNTNSNLAKNKRTLKDCFFLIDHWSSSEHQNISIIKSEIDLIQKTMSDFRKKGIIRGYCNSRVATSLEDKLEILKLKSLVNIPKTFFFEQKEQLKSLNLGSKKYIIKPRHGYMSIGTNLLDNNSSVPSDLYNYIIQEKIDYEKELRFYFFEDKFLLARLKKPNIAPWNNSQSKGDEKKISFIKKEKELPKTIKLESESDYSFGKEAMSQWLKDSSIYKPSKKEINLSRDVAKEAKLTYGAIDWIVDKEGKMYLLEINGIKTYLGSKNYHYDLSEEILCQIKKKYFDDLV